MFKKNSTPKGLKKVVYAKTKISVQKLHFLHSTLKFGMLNARNQKRHHKTKFIITRPREYLRVYKFPKTGITIRSSETQYSLFITCISTLKLLNGSLWPKKVKPLNFPKYIFCTLSTKFLKISQNFSTSKQRITLQLIR